MVIPPSEERIEDPAARAPGAEQAEELGTGGARTLQLRAAKGGPSGTPPGSHPLGANGTPPAARPRAVAGMDLEDHAAQGAEGDEGAVVEMETFRDTFTITKALSPYLDNVTVVLEYQRPVGSGIEHQMERRWQRIRELEEPVKAAMAVQRPAISAADQLEHNKRVSRSPTYKVQPPQCFSGQQPGQGDRQAQMKLAEDLESFLSAMPEYLRLTHTPAEDWALLAATYLRGVAQSYYRALLNAQGADFHPDWTWFCNSLRDHFVSPAQAAYTLHHYFSLQWAKGINNWSGLKSAEEVAWQKVQATLGADSAFFTQGTTRVWTLVRANCTLATLPPRALDLVITNEDLKPHSEQTTLLRMLEKRATGVNEALAANVNAGGKRQRSEQPAGHDGASTSAQQQPAASQPAARNNNCRACHKEGHYVDACPNEEAKNAFLAANPNYKVRGHGGRFGGSSSGGRGSGAPSGRFGGRDSAGRGHGRGRGMQHGSMAAAVPAPPANQ